jgi:hypothetical protein
MTRVLFVGGPAHGEVHDLRGEPYSYVVPVPPRFDVGAAWQPAIEVPCRYLRDTLMVGPPIGAEGPSYPIEVMVADQVRLVNVADAGVVLDALKGNRDWRASLIRDRSVAR